MISTPLWKNSPPASGATADFEAVPGIFPTVPLDFSPDRDDVPIRLCFAL
jgi:hypothetical protein